MYEVANTHKAAMSKRGGFEPEADVTPIFFKVPFTLVVSIRRMGAGVPQGYTTRVNLGQVSLGL